MTDTDRSDILQLSPSGLRTLAREKLLATPDLEQSGWRQRSDYDLNPGMEAESARLATAREAAVLVPVVARDRLTVLLTRRAAHLPSHAGQIAFPGGKIDPDDVDPVAAALREAEEEIGLGRALVEVIGFLDPYRTRTGFRVTPVVALVEPTFRLALDEREVDVAFEVPWAFLMDGANHQMHSRLAGGETRRFYAMPFGEHYIWGATAGMIKNLHERLTAA